MSDKTRRALARIALVFMAVFTVSFVIFLAKPDIWNGAAAFIALFSGIAGIGLFLFIKFYEKSRTENEPKPDETGADGDAPEDAGQDVNAGQSGNGETEAESESGSESENAS